MSKFVRILVVAFLAVFAAGSVVHAASTTTMTVKMALADSGPMDMAECAACDPDGGVDEGGPICSLVCTAPFVADLGTGDILSGPVVVATATPKGVYDFVGRTSSPEPHPPRALI